MHWTAPDRLRKTRLLFPFVIFFYCLFVKGCIRDGWAGVYYAFQRMMALYLIEDDLKRESRGEEAGDYTAEAQSTQSMGLYVKCKGVRAKRRLRPDC